MVFLQRSLSSGSALFLSRAFQNCRRPGSIFGPSTRAGEFRDAMQLRDSDWCQRVNTRQKVIALRFPIRTFRICVGLEKPKTGMEYWAFGRRAQLLTARVSVRH